MAVIFEDFLGIFPDAQQFERYMLVRCPFHGDENPSLMIFRDGWFRCLGSECRRNGRWITLWNKVMGQPVQVMPEWNTRWNGPRINDDLETVSYQAHLDLTHFSSFQWYLEMRHIEGRIESNELGYWDGWYTIPVRDREGNFITAVLRAAPHVQEVTKLRYWSNHEPVMFVPDWRLYDTSDYCLVVFGMFDALAMSDLRLPVVTSTLGNLSFSADWLDECRKPIYIMPDKGEETVASKLSANLGWRGKVIRLPYPEGMKDPADYHQADKGGEILSILNEIRSIKKRRLHNATEITAPKVSTTYRTARPAKVRAY